LADQGVTDLSRLRKMGSRKHRYVR
jgi:hypothetical protein